MDTSGDALPVKPFSFGAGGDNVTGQKISMSLEGEGEDDAFTLLLGQPAEVKRRVQALRKVQLDTIKVEAAFYQKVHELECEYAAKFQDQFEKRKSIVSGSHEPTDEEADYPLIPMLSQLTEEFEAKLKMANGEPKEGAEKVKGIPDFWMMVIKNNMMCADMVQEADDAILKHLTDVTLTVSKEPMNFSLHFHFSPNEYFTNAVLDKEYKLSCTPSEEDPFDFDGPEIVSCHGCKIEWKAGKNVTVKIIKKKQKHKAKAQTRFVNKEVKADSFFNFFDPPQHDTEKFEDLDDETKMLLHADYEIGQAFRDTMIPRAVLCYTGEADDGESMDDEFDDEDQEDEDDEDEDDE
jgi:nucleosome assembly protein 1-like 1